LKDIDSHQIQTKDLMIIVCIKFYFCVSSPQLKLSIQL
ncbi:MAG: hypothetical protein ACI9N3_000422, partial [Colwellia sp.]